MPARGANTYPWDQWFSRRREFKLVRNKHFGCRLVGMKQQIKNEAGRRMVSVSIRVDVEAETLYVKIGDRRA